MVVFLDHLFVRFFRFLVLLRVRVRACAPFDDCRRDGVVEKDFDDDPLMTMTVFGTLFAFDLYANKPFEPNLFFGAFNLYASKPFESNCQYAFNLYVNKPPSQTRNV